MHFGASPRVFRNAKKLRNNMTYAEKLLWSRLRNNQLGIHFRRQHPSSNFVVDFYCYKLQFLIEVDGSIHAEPIVQIEDKCKEDSLISYELHVIRFTNEQVVLNIDNVVALIKKEISVLVEKGPI